MQKKEYSNAREYESQHKADTRQDSRSLQAAAAATSAASAASSKRNQVYGKTAGGKRNFFSPVFFSLL